MTDLPVIFSAPMVRALLDGRKTQTRRLLPAAHPKFPNHCHIRTDVLAFDPHHPEAWYWDGVHESVGASYPIRYAPGDRLWVREAFNGPKAYEVNKYPIKDWGNKPFWFVADGKPPEHLAWQFWPKARPSIHMPRMASRITLTVTEVRVQRLQAISAEDSIAEGVQCETCEAMNQSACHGRGCFASIDAFRALWNSLHGPDAWGANPWVVAVSFTVQRGNIDWGSNA